MTSSKANKTVSYSDCVAESHKARKNAPIIVRIPIPIPKVVGQSVPEEGRAACGVAVGAAVPQEQLESVGQDELLQYPL